MFQLPDTRYSRLALIALAAGWSATASASEPFASDSPWMLGDWGGTRSTLLEAGYDFTLGYTGEMGSNLHGGYDHDRSARYSDQFTFGSHLDLEKILGWHDTELQLTITERHGNNISNDRINDPRVGGFTSAQEVWGRTNLAAHPTVGQTEVLRWRPGREIRPFRRGRRLQQLPL